jgi:hypothetical protein
MQRFVDRFRDNGQFVDSEEADLERRRDELRAELDANS